VVERWEKTPVKAQTVERRRFIIEYREKYMTARRGGGRGFTTRRCSVLEVPVSKCSISKDI